MTTIAQLRNEIKATIAETLTEETSTLARDLICDTLDISLTQLLMHSDDTLSDETVQEIRHKALRIRDNEPLQYVTGKAYFGGRVFKVNTSTLIPRPETEQLTSLICQATPSDTPQRILDIGTGSGCIAITLKCNMPHSTLHAIDISEKALQQASANALRHKADITFERCDILNDTPSAENFDIVVSNPPYICESERTSMADNVLLHEPHTALFVPDNDPLLFYRRIATLCLEENLLRKEGTLYFEINEAYGTQTKLLLENLGYAECQILHDIYGKERIVIAKKI